VRLAARIGGAVAALCVALLLVDYGIARYRAPRDEKLITALQKQVKAEASLAPKLAAEQKRITSARKARKLRDTIAGYVLIAGASLFLYAAKRLLRGARRRAVSAEALVEIAPAAARSPRTPAGAAPPIDLGFVDETVAKLGGGREAAIPLLQAIQAHYRYLPDEALRRLCEITEITPAQVAGTSSFYGQFRSRPVGKHIVKVCHGTACHVAGARQVTDELRRHLGIPEGSDTDPDRMFTVEEVACLGCCSLAPVLMVDEQTAGRLTPAAASAAVDAVEPKEKV
jgi:NADH:ubiquinone oxidoreductase subunit E